MPGIEQIMQENVDHQQEVETQAKRGTYWNVEMKNLSDRKKENAKDAQACRGQWKKI